tara:strand:+ start:135 stop:542 length:408 start_codon:yes stop_codon:yes gene_type:complete
MAEKYYFDTSIWVDFYDKRGYNGEQAKLLLKKIIMEDKIVIYSDFVVKELKDLGFSDFEIHDMIGIAKPDHVKRIHITKQQAEEAKRLTKQRDIPFGDALHAVLARDHEAQLVSRDRHFENIKDITIKKIPEDLI